MLLPPNSKSLVNQITRDAIIEFFQPEWVALCFLGRTSPIAPTAIRHTEEQTRIVPPFCRKTSLELLLPRRHYQYGTTRLALAPVRNPLSLSCLRAPPPGCSRFDRMNDQLEPTFKAAPRIYGVSGGTTISFRFVGAARLQIGFLSPS